MKILFVCQHNVGRSQMAKAFYNELTHSHDAESAGLHVMEPGQTILERKAVSTSKNFFVIDVMKEAGIDMSDYRRGQIDEHGLNPTKNDLAAVFLLYAGLKLYRVL